MWHHFHPTKDRTSSCSVPPGENMCEWRNMEVWQHCQHDNMFFTTTSHISSSNQPSRNSQWNAGMHSYFVFGILKINLSKPLAPPYALQSWRFSWRKGWSFLWIIFTCAQDWGRNIKKEAIYIYIHIHIPFHAFPFFSWWCWPQASFELVIICFETKNKNQKFLELAAANLSASVGSNSWWMIG